MAFLIGGVGGTADDDGLAGVVVDVTIVAGLFSFGCVDGGATSMAVDEVLAPPFR